MWYIHAIERYSAAKKNEVLLHATASVNLEHFTLSPRREMGKPTYCMTVFYDMSRTGESIRTGSRLVLP